MREARNVIEAERETVKMIAVSRRIGVEVENDRETLVEPRDADFAVGADLDMKRVGYPLLGQIVEGRRLGRMPIGRAGAGLGRGFRVGLGGCLRTFLGGLVIVRMKGGHNRSPFERPPAESLCNARKSRYL